MIVDDFNVPKPSDSLINGMVFGFNVGLYVHKSNFLVESYKKYRIAFVKNSGITFESNIEHSFKFFLKVLKREVTFFKDFRNGLISEEILKVSSDEELKKVDSIIQECVSL